MMHLLVVGETHASAHSVAGIVPTIGVVGGGHWTSSVYVDMNTLA